MATDITKAAKALEKAERALVRAKERAHVQIAKATQKATKKADEKIAAAQTRVLEQRQALEQLVVS
jgi:vacuolar-type H+-ATPase subunit E/Vma4